MKNRKKRVEVIVDIIRNHTVSSQEELSNLLAERGYQATQATLSRDLKMLKTTKVATDRGNYMYVLPDSNAIKDKLLAKRGCSLNASYQSGFISLKFSGNIAVIKTRNGYAQGLAYDLDMSRMPEIIGTIAGSDTVFAVIREGITHEEVKKALAFFLPLDSNTIPID